MDPEEVYSEAIAAWDETGPKDLLDKTLEFCARFYLQDAILAKVDRASMLSSLEVRAPYLDADVADFARRLPHRLKVTLNINIFTSSLSKRFNSTLWQNISIK